MDYRKFRADRIFDGYRFREGQVLVMNNKGRVEGLVSSQEAGEGVEEVEGILCPGFINCHCHVELSYLRGFIPPGTGLVGFLTSIVRNRSGFTGEKEPAIRAADEEMYRSGIQGVADICNTTDALPIKKASRMNWHSLVEVINFYDRNLEKQMGWPQTIVHEHEAAGLSAALSPHAPYSVSARTMEEINHRTQGRIISIHNQETAAEDELFQKGTGDFIGFYQEFGNPGAPFPTSGYSSLKTWLPRFTQGQTLLVVHNTFIGEEDLEFAADHAARYGLNIAYCLCPNANLYIEGRLPPAALLHRQGRQIVLGTDSYSSNHQLSISAELAALRQGDPSLPLESLLRWATSAGAEVMRWSELGSFERGKRPGLVRINEQDLAQSERVEI